MQEFSIQGAAVFFDLIILYANMKKYGIKNMEFSAITTNSYNSVGLGHLFGLGDF